MTRDERELDWRRFQEHRFVAPCPDLAPWVARHWVVDWDYDRPYRQVVVPYPDVHLHGGDGALGVERAQVTDVGQTSEQLGRRHGPVGDGPHGSTQEPPEGPCG